LPLELQRTLALPADFAERCARALRGTPEAKIALYNDVEQLMNSHPGHEALLQALSNAIFTADLATLAPELDGEDAALWAEIVAAWRNLS
jgi:hypothetical protein